MCLVSLGLDGCEVRLCDPCARVSRVSRVCPGVRPGTPGMTPGVFFGYRLQYFSPCTTVK